MEEQELLDSFEPIGLGITRYFKYYTARAVPELKKEDMLGVFLPIVSAILGRGKESKKNATPELMSQCGQGWRFYTKSCLTMEECASESVALTVTSPPYWNAIDYDSHANQSKGDNVWYRKRTYAAFGENFLEYLEKITQVFSEVLRITCNGGFCAIVIGTILHKGKHYPAPFRLVERLENVGWNFHQDIVWNKVTGGVKRAGSFIQHPCAGYYYPNIMTEYIMVFRKGEKKRYGTETALPLDALFTREIANNVWHIAPVPPNTIAHPCPFPEELVRRLVLLYSQKGDEVLDPFLGSGQTAKVALRLGRRAVGYDIEARYIALSKQRLLEPNPRKYHLLAKFEKVAVGGQ